MVNEVEAEIKYSGYLLRQENEVTKLQKNENTLIPEKLDYDKIAGLSNEARQRLLEAKPTTLARASRIPGITPATLSLLMVSLRKFSEEISPI